MVVLINNYSIIIITYHSERRVALCAILCCARSTCCAFLYGKYNMDRQWNSYEEGSCSSKSMKSNNKKKQPTTQGKCCVNFASARLVRR